MKTFFYMGRNNRTIGGVSWKIWKIARKGNRVETRWGPAMLVRRKVVPKSTLQSKAWRFRNKTAAKEFERKRIQSKLAKGYERSTHRRR
jgi:cbb3-type cytochrome oxidase cytochrome c subunit